MGLNDSVINKYLSIPEIFADLFNGLIFGGEEVLNAGDLTPVDSKDSVILTGADGKLYTKDRYRDVIKKVINRRLISYKHKENR